MSMKTMQFMDQADQNYPKKSLKIRVILALSLREDSVYVL